MRNANKITIIILLVSVGLLSYVILKLNKQNDTLNEFASFAAVSIYHINKTLEKSDYNYTKNSIKETYEIVLKTQTEQKFHGKYWKDFDYYAFGKSW